jgi:pimeloyl-ACP methyl ester carboxylesterase
MNLYKSSTAGQPVFFQHGLCGSAAQTIEIFPEDQRFQLHTLECRGHGASAVGDTDALSIETFANDVAAVVENPPVIIGGISMGAAIALRLAVHTPHLVKALIIARPAWLTDNAPANMQPNAEVGNLLAEFPAEEARAKFMASDTAQRLSQQSPDNLKSLLGFFNREPLSVTSELLTRISADGPGVTKNEVRTLTIPVLIIGTQQDAIHPWSMAEGLHSMIPHARLAEIRAKGVDKAAYISEFRQALLRFLEENI